MLDPIEKHMKTLLKPYLLDFLKKQGYQYLISRKNYADPEGPINNIVLIPVAQKPLLSKPSIGFEDCFMIGDKKGNVPLEYSGNRICVLLDRNDVVNFKKYLLHFFKSGI